MHSTSPKTGVPLAHKHLTPNYTLRSLVDVAHSIHGGVSVSHGGAGQQCGTIWECQTDKGWTAYDVQDTAALERAWAATVAAAGHLGGQASVRVAVRGGRNEVDLASMTQSVSGGGGQTRAVRRRNSAAPPPDTGAAAWVWECRTDAGWVTYDTHDAAALERAWAAAAAAGRQASVRVAVRGGRNEVDLAGMTQSVPGGGGQARAVRRRAVGVVKLESGALVL